MTNNPAVVTRELDQRKASRTWAALIKKVFELDPLICPRCGGSMKITAFITDHREVARIMENLGIEKFKPPPKIVSPPRKTIPWQLKSANALKPALASNFVTSCLFAGFLRRGCAAHISFLPCSRLQHRFLCRRLRSSQRAFSYLPKSTSRTSSKTYSLEKAISYPLKFMRAKGCDQCRNTGYKGRQGVFEVMPVRGAVEELIVKGGDSRSIKEAALKNGVTTILQDAYLRVIEGVTTVEEVERVTEE